MRVRGPAGAPVVLCMNGGQHAEVEGTWSASLEWLVDRLDPQFPSLRFAEIRYRIKSWRHLSSCIDDARAALAEIAPPRTLLVGFSMGGAVASSVADDPSVEAVLGLAPWLPERLSLSALDGRRLRVLHGSLDRAFPGVPGVAPSLSRAGFERALDAGCAAASTRSSRAACTGSRSVRRGGRRCRFLEPVCGRRSRPRRYGGSPVDTVQVVTRPATSGKWVVGEARAVAPTPGADCDASYLVTLSRGERRVRSMVEFVAPPPSLRSAMPARCSARFSPTRIYRSG